MNFIDSSSAELVLAERDSTVYTGDYCILYGPFYDKSSYGVLRINPDGFDARSIPIRLICERSNKNRLVLSKKFSAVVADLKNTKISWELSFNSDTPIVARRILLNVPGDMSVDDFSRSVEKCNDIDNRLILVSPSTDGVGHIDISGRAASISDIDPPPDRKRIMMVVRGQTEFELNTSFSRQVVDVVILADVSGSMATEDLGVISENAVHRSRLSHFFGNVSSVFTPKNRGLSRMAAVRNALVQFLNERTRASNVRSRLALIEFDTQCRVRYPDEGFFDLDVDTPASMVARFQDQIGTMQANSAGTNIGQALQFAASYFSQHSAYGNRRLVVLLSDGAHWTAKSESAIGEVLEQLSEDPVRLAEELHHTMRIEIQPIGISTPEIYERFLRENRLSASSACTPDHELLRQLVLLSGGSQTVAGDAAVLETYFRNLGGGVKKTIYNFPTRSLLRPDFEAINAAKFEGFTVCSILSNHKITDAENKDLIESFFLAANQFSESLRAATKGKLFSRLSTMELFRKREVLVLSAPNIGGLGLAAVAVHFVMYECLPNCLTHATSKERTGFVVSRIFSHISSSPFRSHLQLLRNKIGAHGHIERGQESEVDSLALEANAHDFFLGQNNLPDDPLTFSKYIRRMLELAVKEYETLQAVLKESVTLEPYQVIAGEEKIMILDW